jgi:outer membrane protein TolC
VGYAGSAEEYRWESERASARKEVIEAEHSLEIARIALNQLLHKPLELKFTVEEISYDDPSFCTSDPRLEDATDNPWDYKIFRDFLVQQGMKNSPELKRLDTLIQAKRRKLSSSKNAFWAPTIGLKYNLSERFSASGAGSGELSLPAGFPVELGGADDINWEVGVNFSLPLYAGSSRIAEKNKASDELEKLLLDRQAAAEKIEQHIRNSLYNAGTSNASIELSRQAADAARKNYELVSDAYTQGVVSIIELIDAQNFFLVSEQVAANAVYDFIVDMIAVERASGRFWMFRTISEKEQWFNDLERFFLQAGSPIKQ